ncbi:MAG: hypothetical protein ACR5KV_02730 [Wolbachia sp.]
MQEIKNNCQKIGNAITFFPLNILLKMYAAAFCGSHINGSGLLDLNMLVFTGPSITVINFVALLACWI